MPKDQSVSSSTRPKTGPDSEPESSASARAQAMRERLGAQRNADELLAVQHQDVRRALRGDALEPPRPLEGRRDGLLSGDRVPGVPIVVQTGSDGDAQRSGHTEDPRPGPVYRGV